MTPAAKPRVSDTLLDDLRYIADPDQPTPDNGGFHPNARETAQRAIEHILGLRAEVSESARWRECAQALAWALRNVEHAGGEYGGECPACAFEKDWTERHDPEGCVLSEALARFDAMKKGDVVLHAGSTGSKTVPVDDVNAAIKKLQRELDGR